MTDVERAVVEAAITQPWTPQLREMLALAVKHRGGYVKRHDSCGDLAELLELLASDVGSGRPESTVGM